MSSSSLKNSFWKHLWLRPALPLIVFVLFNLILSAALGYITPYLIADFYQSLKDEASFSHHLKLLAGLFIVEYFNRFFFQVSTHRYVQLLIMDVRERSFSLWLKAPFKKGVGKKHEDYPMGEVLARLMNDTDAIREMVSSGGFSIFIDIIFILSYLISFLRLNSTTGIALFIAEIIACVFLVQGSKYMAKIFMEVRRVTGMMARVVTDLTSGLKELFYSPNPKYATQRGSQIFDDFLNKQLKANIWDAGYYSTAESLYPVLVAMVMLIVPYSGIVEVAILAALIDLIQKSIGPIKEIASKISVIQRASTGLIRLSEFNDSFSHNTYHKSEFEGLSVERMNFNLQKFSYDEGFTLEEINFDVRRGEILGILGESGCGKSTLLKLLSGQYHTFQGHIEIDELIIDPSKEKELREFSSYVSLISQDSHVFTESLKFNITLGHHEGFENFWEIAQKSIPYLKRWDKMPDDMIGPKLLSMGQKQLISGLRALFLKKPIILMDEISSGLDSELEAALRDLIKFFQSRSITIIVTHRLETILNADRLILLDKGRLSAIGPHSLLQNEPKYRNFLEHL